MERTKTDSSLRKLWFHCIRSAVWDILSHVSPMKMGEFEHCYSSWFYSTEHPQMVVREAVEHLDPVGLAIQYGRAGAPQSVYGWVAGGIYLEYFKEFSGISSTEELSAKREYLLKEAGRRLDRCFVHDDKYQEERNSILNIIKDRLDEFALRLCISPTRQQKGRLDSMRRLLVGKSPAFEEALTQVEHVSAFSVNVLLTGETGVGKELIAAFIHRLSARTNQPFISVNCAAISSHLFESELFGHERGAFTGAVSSKRGLVEAADKGTLFLDEVGDLQPEHQAKLLRFMQDGTYRRVGGLREDKADVRIIAATNRDLRRGAEEGSFREDLYYRLAAFPIYLPPLREREKDISLLVHHFLETFSARESVPQPAITPEALARLQAYRWPGNIRELKNVVEQAVIKCRGGAIETLHLPPEVARDRTIHSTSQPQGAKEEKVNVGLLSDTANDFCAGLSKRRYYRAYVEFLKQTGGLSFRISHLVDFFASSDIGTQQSRVKLARSVLKECPLVHNNGGKTRQYRARMDSRFLNDPFGNLLRALESLLMGLESVIPPDIQFLLEDLLIEHGNETFSTESVKSFMTPDIVAALTKKKFFNPTKRSKALSVSTCGH